MTVEKVPQLRKGLKDNVIKLIQENPEVISKLVIESKKSYPTITRWVRDNKIMLTQSALIDIICSEFRLTKEDVIA